jgi:hypothetical protein
MALDTRECPQSCNKDAATSTKQENQGGEGQLHKDLDIE